MDLPNFIPGQLYKRSSIHDKFGGSRQSGIAPSKQAPVVFAFTGESGAQHGYFDTWDASHQVFSYTGEGQRGPMKMTAGNAAIRDHVEHGRALHLFEIASKAETRAELPNAQGSGYCRYVGEMQCAGVIEGVGVDSECAERKTFQFQLVRVEALEADRAVTSTPPDSQPHTPKNRDLKGLRESALQAAAPAKKKSTDAKRSLFERATQVVIYALVRAHGRCEACEADAPFVRADGTPYLEVHHIDRLSDGGLDAPHRVAAICPTCHRRIHCGAGGAAINDALRIKIEQLEKALSQRLR